MTRREEPVRALKQGDVAGDYRIDGHIADGGMASVYEATHRLIGKRAAVKVLNNELSQSRFAVARFLREARAVNKVQHANIVDIFAFGQLPDGRRFLVMELLHGETLYARMTRGKVEVNEALDVLVQIADALEGAHAVSIAHLDLKPENVFLVPARDGAPPRVKLLDFGIAKLFDHVPRQAPTEFCGTPDYASPEQAQALATIDHKSDVYSFGVLAYELLCGQRPFDAPDARDILWKHVHQTPTPPSAYGAIGNDEQAATALEALVLQMLAKDPSQRPSIGEVRTKLVALRRTPRRKKQPLVAVAAMLFIVALTGSRLVTHRTASAATTSVPEAVATAKTSYIMIPHVAEARAKKHTHHARVVSKAAETKADYVLDYTGKPR